MVKAKPHVCEPQRLAQSLGAALALCGVARAMPLLIGAQGCAAMAGELLSRHFRRAVSLPSLAMNEVSAALGGRGELEAALAEAEREHGAELIGLITSGINEARGDALSGLSEVFDRRAKIFGVSTPDFSGSLQDGWAKAVEGLVRVVAREGGCRRGFGGK